MPLMFASAGIGFGGTNSAAFMRLASPLAAEGAVAPWAVDASDRLSLLPSPPPHDINSAATQHKAACRPARASRSMPPPWRRARLVMRAAVFSSHGVTKCSAWTDDADIPRTRGAPGVV